MRTEAVQALVLGATLVMTSLPSLADSTQISTDERAVLRQSSKRDARPRPVQSPAMEQPPSNLEGAALQAWFDRRYGMQPAAAPPPASEVADTDAEQQLLSRIEAQRNRR